MSLALITVMPAARTLAFREREPIATTPGKTPPKSTASYERPAMSDKEQFVPLRRTG